jgi:hypothetical protein
MRNVSDKSCGENHDAHFIFNNDFFEILTVCEKMWGNMVEPDMAIQYGGAGYGNTIWWSRI